MRVRNTCQDVDGTVQANQTCQASLTKDSGNELIYAALPTSSCALGLTCNVFNASNADLEDVTITGVCEPEKCVGKKVPGNCNGNNPNDPDCVTATARVTICHRTCSEKNPWVRITIDEDAWNGEGCGHRQHDVRDECKNKAPWTAWGVNRMDYLIKYHGTRAQVANSLGGNTAEIKKYWRKWEPACPYVRNGKCCSWTDPDNMCCGDAPGTSYTPVVDVKKYAGPVGQCAAGMMTGLQDVLYTLPLSSSSWQYCYVVTVPSTSQECLYQMSMVDPAPIGGISSGSPIAVTSSTSDADMMCPGDVRYFPGRVVQGLTAQEGPFDATVTGKGVLSLKTVSDVDPASVTPPPVPPTPAPVTLTMAPTRCPMDMGKVDTTICPFIDAVDVIEIKADNNRIIPENLDPSSIFYDLKFVGTAEAPEVSFKIDNPFDFEVDMYIQYHSKAKASTSGALDPACVGRLEEPACNPSATSITAGCIKGSTTPFTLVSVFFISENSLFGDGSSEVTPYECCPIPSSDLQLPIIQYTFKVLCECPVTSRQLLRGQKV